MGSYLSSSASGPRRPRRLATSAIGLVAVIGLVTACTASSVGAAKPVSGRSPDRYPAGVSVPAKAMPLSDSMESIRLEKKARREMNIAAARPRTPSGHRPTHTGK